MGNTCLDLKIELERGVVVERIGVLEAILIFLSMFASMSESVQQKSTRVRNLEKWQQMR